MAWMSDRRACWAAGVYWKTAAEPDPNQAGPARGQGGQVDDGPPPPVEPCPAPGVSPFQPGTGDRCQSTGGGYRDQHKQEIAIIAKPPRHAHTAHELSNLLAKSKTTLECRRQAGSRKTLSICVCDMWSHTNTVSPYRRMVEAVFERRALPHSSVRQVP